MHLFLQVTYATCLDGVAMAEPLAADLVWWDMRSGVGQIKLAGRYPLFFSARDGTVRILNHPADGENSIRLRLAVQEVALTFPTKKLVETKSDILLGAGIPMEGVSPHVVSRCVSVC